MQENNGLLIYLNKFADDCRTTTGASFTIPKKKSGEWSITFVNRGKAFNNINLLVVLDDAHEWLLRQRKLVEIETSYTPY